MLAMIARNAIIANIRMRLHKNENEQRGIEPNPNLNAIVLCCLVLCCVASHATRRNWACWHPTPLALLFLEKRVMLVGRDVNMHNALALRAKHAHCFGWHFALPSLSFIWICHVVRALYCRRPKWTAGTREMRGEGLERKDYRCKYPSPKPWHWSKP